MYLNETEGYMLHFALHYGDSSQHFPTDLNDATFIRISAENRSVPFVVDLLKCLIV